MHLVSLDLTFVNDGRSVFLHFVLDHALAVALVSALRLLYNGILSRDNGVQHLQILYTTRTLTLRPSMVVSSCSTSKTKFLLRSGNPSADPLTLYWSPSWEYSQMGRRLRTFWRFSGGTPS